MLPKPTTDAGKKVSPPVQEMPGRKPAQPPDVDGKAVPPGQVDAGALPKGYPRDVSTRAGGRQLAVVAQEGGCGKAGVEIAAQNAQRVALTLVETTPSDPNTMCTMDMRYPVLTVQLEAPLDGRTVVLDSERRKG